MSHADEVDADIEWHRWAWLAVQLTLQQIQRTAQLSPTGDICVPLQSLAMASLSAQPNKTCIHQRRPYTLSLRVGNQCNDLRKSVLIEATRTQVLLTNVPPQDSVRVMEWNGHLFQLPVIIFVGILSNQVQAM